MKAAIPIIVLLAACSSNPEPESTPAPQATTPPVAATPAPTPAAQPSGAFDPVGTFDMVVDVMGQQQSATLNITKTDGKLGGSLVGPDGNALAIESATQDGRKLTLTSTIPNGPVLTFALEFSSNDACKGTVDVAGMGQGAITCTRKKSN